MNSQLYYVLGEIERIEHGKNITEDFETYIFPDDCILFDDYIVINGLWIRPLIISAIDFNDRSITCLIKLWTAVYAHHASVNKDINIKHNPTLRKFNDPSIMLEYNHHMLESVDTYIDRCRLSDLYATYLNAPRFNVDEYFNTARTIRNNVVAKLNA